MQRRTKQDKNLSLKIKNALRKKGLNITKFVNSVGVSISTYQDYLRGNLTGLNRGETKVKRLIKAIDELLEESK